jgi:hypothetical protein
MSETTTTIDGRPKRQRLFLRADGRGYQARRYKAIRAALLARFPQPNLYIMTLCESLAGVQLQLEVERSRQANGEHIDNNSLTKLTNTQRRLLRDLALAETDDA